MIARRDSCRTITSKSDYVSEDFKGKGKRGEKRIVCHSLARCGKCVRSCWIVARARPRPPHPFFRFPLPARCRTPPSPTKLAISSTLSSPAVVYVYAANPTSSSVFATSEPGICPTPTILLGLSFHFVVACPERSCARATTNSFADRVRQGEREKDRDRDRERESEVDKWSRIRHGSSSPQNIVESLEMRSLLGRLRIRHRSDDTALFLRVQTSECAFPVFRWLLSNVVLTTRTGSDYIGLKFIISGWQDSNECWLDRLKLKLFILSSNNETLHVCRKFTKNLIIFDGENKFLIRFHFLDFILSSTLSLFLQFNFLLLIKIWNCTKCHNLL